MRKEIIKELKKLTDIQLIFYIQDINRPEHENFYSQDFRELVGKEVVRRGK